jgi:hypothetical protein
MFYDRIDVTDREDHGVGGFVCVHLTGEYKSLQTRLETAMDLLVFTGFNRSKSLYRPSGLNPIVHRLAFQVELQNLSSLEPARE